MVAMQYLAIQDLQRQRILHQRWIARFSGRAPYARS